MEEDLPFFFSSLLRCIALSLMFLFSFLLMLYIYMILKANHSIRLIMGREAASNSLLQAPHPSANDFKLWIVYDDFLRCHTPLPLFSHHSHTSLATILTIEQYCIFFIRSIVHFYITVTLKNII